MKTLKNFEDFCIHYEKDLYGLSEREKRFRYIWYVQGYIDNNLTPIKK